MSEAVTACWSAAACIHRAKAQCAFAVKECSYHGIPRTAAQLMAAEPSIPLPVESLTLPHNKLLLYAAESRDTVSADPNVLHANAAAVAAGLVIVCVH